MQPGSAIDFLDSSFGWRVDGLEGAPHQDGNLSAAPVDTGYRWPGGSVSATTDGGSAWTMIFDGAAGEANGVWGIDLLSETTGWVVGVTGLFGTVDGGSSWVTLGEPGDASLVTVAFSTDRLGWGLTSQGQLVLSTDGGASWSAAELPVVATSPVLTALCVSGAAGYVVDEQGQVYAGDVRAAAPRISWSDEQPTAAPAWTQVACHGSHVWVSDEYTDLSMHASSGRVFDIVHSSDFGTTWETVAPAADGHEASGPLDIIATTSMGNTSADAPFVVGYPTSGWTLRVIDPAGGPPGRVADLRDLPRAVDTGQDAHSYLLIQGVDRSGPDGWIYLTDNAVGTRAHPMSQSVLLHTADDGKTWETLTVGQPDGDPGAAH